MLRQSNFNPLMKAQWEEGIKRAQLGKMATEHAIANKNWAYATTSESPQGASMVAPITQPVAQQVGQGIDYSGSDQEKKQQQEQQQQPTITRTGDNTGVDQDGNPYYEAKSGSNQWIAGKIPQKPSPNLNSGMAQGGLVRGYAKGGSVDSPMFLNPATGSYEPVQTQQPQAPPSSIWNPTRPTPLAPPAPTTPPQAQAQPPPQDQPQPQDQPGSIMDQYAQGYAQGQDQKRQQDLGNWQNQTQTTPITPKEALDWLHANVTTKGRHATFMRNGGPNGEPAYAFEMDKGGTNIVPVRQMLANGAGPIIAGQNTSVTLSQSDKLRQQQENALAAPPDQSQQPPPGQQPSPVWKPMQPVPGQPAPPAAPGAQGQPPAPQTPPPAPVGAPNMLTDAAPYPKLPGMQDAWSAQLLTQPMPGANGASATAGPPGVARVIPAAAQTTTTTESAAATAAKAKASSAELEADANSSKPIYDWRPEIGTDGKTHMFTSLPDPEGRPFVSQRYYKGSLSGFQSGTWNTDNRQKEEIYDEMVGTKGVPIPKDEDGNEIKMDAQTIAGFTPEQQRIWLKYVRDYNLHPNAPLATSAEGGGLANAANAIKDAQRIRDKILYLKQNNISMDAISQAEIIRSQEAGYAKAEGGSPVGMGWDLMARGGPQNNFVDELNGDYQKLNDHLAHVPGGTYEHTAGTPKPEDWGIPATDWTPPFGLPKTTNVSKIPALNRIGSGDTYDQALAHIDEVLENAKNDYKQQVDKLGPANYRTPDVDAKNLSDLADPKKGYINDRTNKMWDKDHKIMTNPYGPIPHQLYTGNWTTTGGGEQPASTNAASPSPSPSPPALPRISKYDTSEFDRLKIKKGDEYLGPDGVTTYTRGQ
jgi:hypothetical protein